VTSVSASIGLHGRTQAATAAAVTAALGIDPTRSHETGGPHPSPTLAARGRRTEQSLWLFEEPETFKSDDDFHGMASLDRLAERFETKAEVLSALEKDYFIQVRMISFSDSDQGGFVIAPETMRRLGRLSATFFGDVLLSPDGETSLVE
jgi:hypothetical protein